ncbi:hypothetical protein BDN72DRAFT_830435 [Pluteus cervinus]|uniref:Uncharacterized protein n=1 Tax=Pluteus cervinus TaxID=181527 RepID=A0ACD3BHW3_9AGAR|nr:hypothetical protein BDN72DRAFT_830435 [Pluteus cervinus]
MISAPSSSISTTHKRARATSYTPPTLPKIKSELILTVYTHKSLRRASSPAEYDDNERLAELGKQVLRVVVTNILFSVKPMLSEVAIRKRREELLCGANFQSWVKAYGLQSKLRCDPSLQGSMNTPEEAGTLFCAYAGGLYAESGMEPIQDWLTALLQDDMISIEAIQLTVPQAAETPPLKRIKSEEVSPRPPSPIFFGSQPPPSPIRHPPPHVPMPNPPPNPLSPAQPNLPFLPLFNQTASQRRVTVEYPATFSGPSHACRWTVQCVVNGILKGVGHGSSKQIAKEEAARQAFYAMGWS